jgi:hypothetical protein
MLVVVTLLALFLAPRMIAAASARMILGDGGRGRYDNRQHSENTTKSNHIGFPKICARRPLICERSR